MTFTFDPELCADETVHEQTRPSEVRARATVPVVTAKASVTPRTTDAKKDWMTRAPERWTWDDLRNYVISKIAERDRGVAVQAEPRTEGREVGIFTAFAGRHGEQAGPIAVFAFETSSTPGYWRGAPISTTRFCRNSDPYFAEPIKDRLTAV